MTQSHSHEPLGDVRACGYPDCAATLNGRRPNVTYCDDRCRNRARRKRARANGPSKPRVHSGPRPTRRKYQPGDRFGELTLLRYAGRSRHGDTMVEFACKCGRTKTLRLGNVTSGVITNCAERTSHADPRAAGDAISIGKRHEQIAKRLGSARDLPCVVCGVVSNGNGWAYRHSSPEARTQLVGKNRGQVFSTDDADYWVMCARHHSAWDRGHRDTVPKGALSLAHVTLAMAVDPGYQ